MELHGSNSVNLSDLKCRTTSKQDEYIAEEEGGRQEALVATYSSENVESEELTLQQDHLIYSIELILKIILKYLKTCDLLTSRLINNHFSYVATKFIQFLSPPIFLNFTYSASGKQAYVLSPPNKTNISSIQNSNQKNIINCNNNNDLTLSSLSKLMETSWNFPVHSFSFKKGRLDENGLQEFLSCHGYHIKSISLELFQKRGEKLCIGPGNPPAVSILKQLLFLQTPHLSWLELLKFPRGWSNSVERLQPTFEFNTEIFNTTESLQNLTSFQIGKTNKPIKIIEDIVKYAPNLKTVQTHSFQYVFNDQFNKFYLLRFLYFYPEKDNIDQYESLASSRKTFFFESISINLLANIGSPEFNDRMSDVLWKLLSASASTLTALKLLLPFCLLWDPTIEI